MYVKKGQLTAKERAEMMGGMSAVRKPLLLLLLVQAAMGAFAFAKGVGPEYLMICAGLIPCTVTVLVLANADWYLASRDLGADADNGQSSLRSDCKRAHKADVTGMLLKLAVAIAAASAAALAFRFWGKMLGREWAGILLMLLQACIYLFLAVKGTTVGQAGGGQAARITLEIAGNDIQILELTRMIYVCVLVLLLCKQSKDTFLFIPRETAAILYTVITMAVPVFFRDLGSSLIIGGIFLIMYTTFAKNRKQVLFMWIAVLIAAAVGVLLVIGLKDAGIFKKIYLRFYYFLFPEKDIARYGYQYIQIRQALAVGGLLGADSRRYMFDIARQRDDLAYVKLVQTSGALVGIVVILTFLLLFREERV
ncbi:MAG: FtsW/RodA/SpoVE family cell cycle protein [[Clostridium] scindens]